MKSLLRVVAFVLATTLPAAAQVDYYHPPGGTGTGGGGGSATDITVGVTTLTGGVNKQCVFDDNGLVGEDAGCTYDKATDTLSVTGDVLINGSSVKTALTGSGRTVQAASCADSGNGSPGALTLTPSARNTLVKLTNLDADGCTVTMGEGSAQDGDAVTIVIVSTAGGAVTVADTAGVSEMSGDFAMGLWDSLSFDYVTDRFVERSRSNQ